MSTDIIADALIPACESGIKSLSQVLTTLHSIDALGRLKEKADVVTAFAVIASFAPFFSPAIPAGPPETVKESAAEEILERMEPEEEEALGCGELLGFGEPQDEATVISHPPATVQLSTVQDGRGDDVMTPDSLLPSPQSASGPSRERVPPADLLHPVRHSELTLPASEKTTLYSFLLHFPVFSANCAVLSHKDKEELFLLPTMAKWGFGNSMTTLAYPRLRLTNKGTACLVVDDDMKRLQDIRKDLEEAEREHWEKSAVDNLDRKFFIVGTWKEEYVALAFSSSSPAPLSAVCPTFERWTAPGNLWSDILKVYPVLSRYQELAHGQRGAGRLPGAGLFCHKRLHSRNHYNFPNVVYVTLVVPLIGSPHALMFANDFVAQYSPMYSDLPSGGTRYSVDVEVVRMGPPALKDDGNWDGPVLRNDK